MKVFITRTRQWYQRNERPIASLSLIGGFVFDAVTLKRVDLLWENIWVGVHLVAVGVCILLINYWHDELADIRDSARIHFWLLTTSQFFFGGLLSVFLVFYFRSAELSVTWPFLLLLALAFIANERLKEYYAQLTFQIGLFFLSIFAFAIFIVPVFFHKIGTDIFLISGVISLVVIGVFLWFLGVFANAQFRHKKWVVLSLIVGIYATINILYFLNLIPPLPLALKDAGVYHGVTRDSSGNYVVEAEDVGWFGYFVPSSTFHKALEDAVYAYTAIFSPAAFNTDIIHVWQKYDDASGGWVTVTESSLLITGGREGGFRTYSFKRDIDAGRWRVNVETTSGQVIGRLRFKVVEVSKEPSVTDVTKK
ncbi:MAG: DUF2914 domain-containing protein [Patescibacteria group bacterium]